MPSNTGLLIIRAYLEAGSQSPLRAEIRLTSDVSAGIERTLTLIDRDRVSEVVQRWLDDILKTDAGATRFPPSPLPKSRI
jgi:hypothetical protein